MTAPSSLRVYGAQQSWGSPQSWAPARARSRASRAPRIFFFFLTLTMAAGTVVMIEPAPVDVALMILLVCGLFLGAFRFTAAHGTPLALFGCIAIANLVSLIYAVDLPHAILYCATTVYLMQTWVFYAGLVSRYGNRAVQALWNGYAIAAMVSAVPATLAYFGVIPFQRLLLLFGRPKGFFKDPNVYGPYLVPVVLFAFAKLEMEHGWRRVLWAAVCLSCLVGLFLSYSRACWINMLVAAAVYFVVTRLIQARSLTSRSSLAGIAPALSVAALALVVVISIPQVRQMISLRLGSDGLQTYDGDRFSTQTKALEMAIEQPFGIGPGQAEIAFDYSTHSTYLRLLSENGPLALSAFAALLVLTLLRAIHGARTLKSGNWRILMAITTASLAGYIVNSFVIDTVHWRHIWLFLALPWASHPDMQRTETAKG